MMVVPRRTLPEGETDRTVPAGCLALGAVTILVRSPRWRSCQRTAVTGRPSSAALLTMTNRESALWLWCALRCAAEVPEAVTLAVAWGAGGAAAGDECDALASIHPPRQATPMMPTRPSRA